MTDLITVIVSIATSASVSSIILALLNRKWQKEDAKYATHKDLEPINCKLKYMVDSQKLMTSDRIRDLVKIAIKDGQITLADKEHIMNLYSTYKELGGNGGLNTIMGELEKLKVVELHNER